MQSINECQDIDELEAELKAARKQKAKEDREAKKQKRQAMVFDGATEFVAQTPIYFVGRLNLYALRNDRKWCFLKKSALYDLYPEFCDSDFAKAFTLAMHMANRTFIDCGYSLAQPSPDTLNLLDISGWIEPEPGEYHWLFDVLMTSLGGGKPENIEHIERCIAYKRVHPNCPTLPALVIHGEGSLGKNLLVEQVLDVALDGMTVAGNVRTLLGQFNSPMKGKVVALVDEANPNKIDQEELLNRTGSSVLTINEKGIPQYQQEAIAWYIISSNRDDGSIFLDRSSADRRWSVCYVEPGKDLYHWLRPKLGNVTYAEAETWLKANAVRILRDKKNVARWLHALIAKYEGQSQPLPFHGDDFHRLMDIQKPADELIIEAVFNDPAFTHINRRTLYDGYKLACADHGRRPSVDRKFYGKVRAWLAANKPEIGSQEVQTRFENSSDHAYLWIKAGTDEKAVHRKNDSCYLADHQWTGPENR